MSATSHILPILLVGFAIFALWNIQVSQHNDATTLPTAIGLVVGWRRGQLECSHAHARGGYHSPAAESLLKNPLIWTKPPGFASHCVQRITYGNSGWTQGITKKLSRWAVSFGSIQRLNSRAYLLLTLHAILVDPNAVAKLCLSRSDSGSHSQLEGAVAIRVAVRL